MLYCSAVIQRCFINYNSVVLFYYVALQNYNVVLFLVMLVCHVLLLFCTDMFFVTTMTLWYSAAQSFIPTPVSHHIYLRSQPTQSTPLFGTTWMTQSVSLIHDTRRTDISSFSQWTKLKMFLTTHVTHHIYLYIHPTQCTHVFSPNVYDPKRLLKLYNYYLDTVYF